EVCRLACQRIGRECCRDKECDRRRNQNEGEPSPPALGNRLESQFPEQVLLAELDPAGGKVPCLRDWQLIGHVVRVSLAATGSRHSCPMSHVSSRSRERARDSRERTVPTGVPSATAACS